MRQSDGSAECTSILITLQDLARNMLLVIKERVGVESVVANEIEAAAVPLVGSGLGYDRDDAAAIPPIFGSVIVFQNAELFDGVGIGVEYDAFAELLVVKAAVQQVRNGIRTTTADVEAAAGTGVSLVRRSNSR